MDAQSLALLVAGLLAMVFKATGAEITKNHWFLFGCAVVLSLAALLLTGGLTLPQLGNDPLAFLETLAKDASAVYTLAAVVYAFLGDQLGVFLSKVKAMLG